MDKTQLCNSDNSALCAVLLCRAVALLSCIRRGVHMRLSKTHTRALLHDNVSC